MDIDEALDSPEKYAQYIRSLGDPDSGGMYSIVIDTDTQQYVNHLLWADSDSAAIEQFDLRFLELHRDGIDGKPIAMRLLSPEELGEGRTILAEIKL